MEYKQKGKSNKFVDRRFGEDDPDISVEDKMLKRFALERSVSKYYFSALKYNNPVVQCDKLLIPIHSQGKIE